MADIEPAARPLAHEDSITRFISPSEQTSRRVVQRFDKRELVLVDGPNAGATVEYFIPVTVLEDPVEVKHPGVPGLVEAGSRWSSTSSADVVGADSISISSPTPGAQQSVVVDWISYTMQVTVVGDDVSEIVEIEDSLSASILWSQSVGFVTNPPVGTVETYTGPSPILVGTLGSPITMSYPVNAGVEITVSLNFGGYFVDV